jgi:hypothetical protein
MQPKPPTWGDRITSLLGMKRKRSDDDDDDLSAYDKNLNLPSPEHVLKLVEKEADPEDSRVGRPVPEGGHTSSTSDKGGLEDSLSWLGPDDQGPWEMDSILESGRPAKKMKLGM